ncbi:GMC family oxidoreductase [Ulvibacterium marinum]|uniref:GMC family oxidoreductase n=1 Tax=Ulvibacterium marinum TaxID=2419782 RepID=UPI002493D858|nr:GMC family oxidoreductase [Ulvibacterium marinum]
MHKDLGALSKSTIEKCDLCIVGAGAAGISMAMDWLNQGKKVVLLEAGGFEFETETQALNQGTNIGQRYYSLTATRLRFFGGTTGHWGGYCTPLDPIDFETRPYVPNSGWPIDYDEFASFLPRASKLVEIDDRTWNLEDYIANKKDYVSLDLNSRVFYSKLFKFSPPTRFGTKYRKPLVDSNSITVYTHANLTRINLHESGQFVKDVEAQSLNGNVLTVNARHYVLAMGAVQNARMLLANNQQQKAGIGNAYDQVGRYFMEHPEVKAGHIFLKRPQSMKLYFFDYMKIKMYSELAIASSAQRAHGILNMTTALFPKELSGDWAWINKLPKDGKQSYDFWMKAEKNTLSRAPSDVDTKKYTAYQMQIRMEQSPNPNSRITLGDKRDKLGTPQPLINWQLTELERNSIRGMNMVLGKELIESGIGRLHAPPWVFDTSLEWPNTLGGGWHHMGTTRMHNDPKKGVVDAHCTVHGMDNLHIAGSSCFTTAGAANPTLSLIALTLRLSKRLKELLA